MQYVPTISIFISRNQFEVRKMIHSICNRYNIAEVDDILQDFYLLLINNKILDKFDPNHPSATKISTFLYRAAENLILVYLKSNENKIEKHCVHRDCYDFYHRNNEDNMAFPIEKIKTEYENRIYRNSLTDEIDGINFDLDLFEDHLQKINKYYNLRKRKNKRVEEKSLDFLKIFKLLREGYSNREIAQKFGVSDMWICTTKNEIKKLMDKFGVDYHRPCTSGLNLSAVQGRQ